MFDKGFGVEALCDVDDASRATPFYIAARADSPSDPQRCYLVEIEGYQIGATTDLGVRAVPMGFYPISSIPSLPDASVGLTTLRYSDSGYTAPDQGVMASQPFEGRVSQALRLNMTVPLAPENTDRIVSTTASVEIINVDGALDDIFDQLDLSGRKLTIKYGLVTYAYSQFVTVCCLAIDTASRTLETFSLTARDRGYRLAVPFQTQLYGGGGGIDGTADLANKPRPVAFGKLINIEPIQIDPAYLIYQFHFRAAQAVDAVYDSGAALTFTADYASYALLSAATLSTGQYATCLALGLIRAGGTPAGALTADVRGDANGSYVSNTSDVIKRIITDFAGLTTSDYSVGGFAGFASDVPGTIGWYATDAMTCQDAINEIIGHCAAWLSTTQDGLFTLQRLSPPENGIVSNTFRSYEIEDVEILDAPDGTVPPRFRQTVGYQRNWTVQTGQEVAPAVSDARRLTLSQEYIAAAAQNTQTKSDFILAQDAPVLVSLFHDEADALDVAQRQIDLMSKQRKTVRVIMDCRGHLPKLGSVISIEHPRINDGNLWSAAVIGFEIDADSRQVNPIVWG